MQFNFAIPYALTFEDKVNLLGQDGRDHCDDFVTASLALRGVDPRSPEARDLAVEARTEFFKNRETELRTKVTVDLILAKIVNNKYGDKADRKVQRMWARVQDIADAAVEDRTGVGELSASDASWLVDVLFKPGRGGDPEPTDAWQFPPALARWADTFETEALALCRAVRAKG